MPLLTLKFVLPWCNLMLKNRSDDCCLSPFAKVMPTARPDERVVTLSFFIDDVLNKLQFAPQSMSVLHGVPLTVNVQVRHSSKSNGGSGFCVLWVFVVVWFLGRVLPSRVSLNSLSLALNFALTAGSLLRLSGGLRGGLIGGPGA